MRQISPFRRLFIVALAVLQMATPAALAAADALLEARAGGPGVVHVEDHTRRNCRPAHPDDCALCQLLSHFSPERSAAPGVPSARVVRVHVGDDASFLPSFAARAHQRSRAPPVG
jgi:hypothetical protein